MQEHLSGKEDGENEFGMTGIGGEARLIVYIKWICKRNGIWRYIYNWWGGGL